MSSPSIETVFIHYTNSTYTDKMTYIYLRLNEFYVNENVVKLGIVEDMIKERDLNIDMEIKKGFYPLIIKINPDNKISIGILHCLLRKHITERFKIDEDFRAVGHSFYDIVIHKHIDFISQILTEYRIKHKILGTDEVKRINKD